MPHASQIHVATTSAVPRRECRAGGILQCAVLCGCMLQGGNSSHVHTSAYTLAALLRTERALLHKDTFISTTTPLHNDRSAKHIIAQRRLHNALQNAALLCNTPSVMRKACTTMLHTILQVMQADM